MLRQRQILRRNRAVLTFSNSSFQPQLSGFPPLRESLP